MASVNRVFLIGNLTRDPEVRNTPQGGVVCDIGLAMNRSWKSKDGNTQEEVTFVDITFFGTTAEVAGKYLSKGRQVYIEGRLKLDQWQDKTAGQNRSKLAIIGEQITFLGSKNDSPQQQGQPQQNAQQPAPNGYAQNSQGDDMPWG